METYSNEFENKVVKCLNSDKPLLAAIHKSLKKGFIGNARKRKGYKDF